MRRSGRERGRLRARRWGPARTAGSSTPAFHYFPLFCFPYFHSPFPGNLLLSGCVFFLGFFLFCACCDQPGAGGAARPYPRPRCCCGRPALLAASSRTCRPDRPRYLPGRGKPLLQLPGAAGSGRAVPRSPPTLPRRFLFLPLPPAPHPPFISLSILSPPKTGPPRGGAGGAARSRARPSPAAGPGQLRALSQPSPLPPPRRSRRGGRGGAGRSTKPHGVAAPTPCWGNRSLPRRRAPAR